MKTILKYPLPYGMRFGTLQMHPNAQILTVQMQGEYPMIWALVDTEDIAKPPEDRDVYMASAGHALDDKPGRYIGTFQDGAFVWHVFDRTPGPAKRLGEKAA